MKLVTYRGADGWDAVGVVVDERVVDVKALTPSLPTSVRGLLAADALPQLAQAITAADTSGAVALADVELCAPLPDPGKVVCLAGNYQEHIQEEGGPAKDKATSPPHLFMKPATTILAPEATVVHPDVTDRFDHEIELGVVIGKTAKAVDEAQAREAIAGYTICNDLSSRRITGIVNPDREMSEREKFFDWLIGKWQDGSLPMGPYLVTADEATDIERRTMELRVNGEVRQQGSTGQMIYDACEIVSYVSHVMTLEPGDVISTGTPSGVGMATGKYLSVGDVIECEIEGLGLLRTTVGQG